jgi:prevent-host-death family protein
MATKVSKKATRVATVAGLRARIADNIDAVRMNKERVVLTNHGKPVAALVPIEDYDYLEGKEIAYDNRAADRVMARIKAGQEKLIPHDEVMRRLRRPR